MFFQSGCADLSHGLNADHAAQGQSVHGAYALYCLFHALLAAAVSEEYHRHPVALGALALLYFVCHNIVLDSSIIDKVQYWMIALFGTAILVAIDYALQFIYKRIAILVGKALRKNDRHRKSESEKTDSDDFDEETRPDGDSPFDEFSDDYPRDNNESNEEKGNKGDGNDDCDNENDGANDK